MDVLRAIPTVINTASEVFSDYNLGRKTRLGQYGGDNMRALGHYNAKTGKRLGIYHR